MTASVLVRSVGAAEAISRIEALTDILVDCVEGGASVSFMAPVARATATGFWQAVAASVVAGRCTLLIAEAEGVAVGTVQVVPAPQENQPHRADLAKMLVHRRARNRGVGEALLLAAEAVARGEGRTLLVLDTATRGAGERLYARLGWQRVGIIPGYALYPDGRPCDTTVFYKNLLPMAAS